MDESITQTTAATAAPARTERPRPAARAGTAARSRTPWLAVAAITAVAALLRLVYIGHQGYWMDEGITIGVLHRPFGTMLHALSYRETTPPLYYVLAWFWARIAGYSEAPLRTLSALFGIATVPVIYAAGARIASRRVGLIAAGLAATSPLLVWYSQEVRPYALLVLLAALSLWLFEIARTQPTPVRLLGWGVVSGLAVLAHYFAAMLVVPEAVWLLYVHRRQWATWAAAAIVGGVGLALIPLIHKQSKLADWIAGVPLSDRLAQLRLQFLVGFTGAGFHTAWLIALIVSVIAVGFLVWRGERLERRAGLAMAGLLVAGLVITAAIKVVGKDVIDTRNLLELWLPFAILLAAGLGARRAGIAGIAGALAVCAIGVAGTIYIGADSNLQRPDWRPISNALGPPPAAGDRVVFILRYGSLFPMTLYHPSLRDTPPNWAGNVSEVDVMYAAYAAHRGDCWWGATCELNAVHLARPPRLPGFRVVQVVHRGRFVLLRLRSATPQRETVKSLFGSVPHYLIFPKTLLHGPPS